MEEIKPAVLDPQKWKPEMESSAEGLRMEMGELKSQVVQITRNPVLALRPGNLPPILPISEAKMDLGLGPNGSTLASRDEIFHSNKEQDLGPIGHSDDINHRRKAGGENFSQHHLRAMVSLIAPT